MKEVLIRRQQAHGNLTVLSPAQVISESPDGKMRVVIKGQRGIIEVEAKDTVATRTPSGASSVGLRRSQQVLTQSPTPSRHAIGSMIGK